ncbi:response regulator [Woodsholea maritima]|uniref:response regulator n=1 Tax=Woodsholea maritima TaxID=240237 RepID=UPI00036A0779|nr:response regulator [Woodsholea maritima]
MPFSESLKPHIPYLRRYARILTGSQRSGDAFVRAALEAAIAGEAELNRDLTPQVALYQLFHTTWAHIGPHLSEDAPDDMDISAHASRLAKVTPVARQALLLTAVEGFSALEAATILRTTKEEVDGLLMKAQSSIDNALATDVLIIEDEPIIALDIQAIVENNGHNVVGVARTHTEAVEKAKAKKPGLVLADIQLADGSSGIDAVKEILEQYNVPVIFITAYPERLLTGERPEPTYLITKPFMPETVSATMAQALFFAEGLTQEAQPA